MPLFYRREKRWSVMVKVTQEIRVWRRDETMLSYALGDYHDSDFMNMQIMYDLEGVISKNISLIHSTVTVFH